MSVAPHAGIVDFGTFTPPTASVDGIQGEVPQPLAGEESHIISASGWIPPASASGTVTSVAATVPSFLSVAGSPITTSGTLAIALTSTPTDGQLLIGNGTGFSYATLTAGSNITITNSSGGITIASSGGGGSSSPIPKLLSWSIGGF
jgi:hypothetical protein